MFRGRGSGDKQQEQPSLYCSVSTEDLVQLELWRANSTDTTTDIVITRWRHTRAATERSDKIYKPRPIISVVDIDDSPEATLKRKEKSEEPWRRGDVVI